MDLAEIFNGPLTPAKWRALGEHLDGGGVSGGPGLRVRKVGGKTIITTRKRRGGGSGGPAENPPPLTIVSARPSYVPAPGSAVENAARFFLTWGTVGGRVAANWSDCIDIATTASGRMDFFMKAGLTPTGELKVTTAQWVTAWVTSPTGDPDPDYQTGPFGSDGHRPPFCYIALGSVLVEDGVATILPASAGNVAIYEHVAEIDTASGGAVSSLIRRALSIVRETY